LFSHSTRNLAPSNGLRAGAAAMPGLLGWPGTESHTRKPAQRPRINASAGVTINAPTNAMLELAEPFDARSIRYAPGRRGLPPFLAATVAVGHELAGSGGRKAARNEWQSRWVVSLAAEIRPRSCPIAERRRRPHGLTFAKWRPIVPASQRRDAKQNINATVRRGSTESTSRSTGSISTPRVAAARQGPFTPGDDRKVRVSGVVR